MSIQRRLHRVLSVMIPLLVALSTFAGAQPVSTSFDELRHRLVRDQTVVVTDLDGRETKGRVVDLSGSLLTLRTPDMRTFAAEHIRDVRKTDRVWNGMMNGIWVGLGALVVAGIVGHNVTNDREGFAYELAYIALLFPAVGAVSSILIDRSLGNAPIYQGSGRRSSAAVSPVGARKGIRIALSVEF